MSWQLASFLILGAVLAGGFAWYERSRPPSQVVALVAALAALAIAGRIAFAAFPNVKPTTDIVISAGFALGAAPGFAVGALAALVSNLWFGQGPWTPWQMAGWGLCGVMGAALGLGGRNVGRLTLAATCGFAGIAYGALLNFSLMATYGGELSLERFGVLQARAVPFDAAHVIGNVVLALVAGPAMVRMLIRFRERFEWGRGEPALPVPGGGPGPPGRRLRRGGAVAALLVALALLSLAPAPAEAAGIQNARAWLVSVQNSDGGFGASPDDDSGTDVTCWAMLGLEAAGRNPLDVSRNGRTPVDFLRANAGDIQSPGDLARTVLALEGAGVDPRDFADRNLVSELLGRRRDNGSWEGWPGSTAFAVIALRTAGASGGLQKSLDWLRKVQNEDGGWGDVPGSPSTSDGTGAVLQALSSGSKASQRGLSYLRKAQRPGGGFPLGGGGTINTQSTAWAVQGILGAGGDPGSYRRGGESTLDYLAKQQEADGSYRYSGSSDQTPVWVTGQVLVAVAGESFPVAVPAREPQPKKPKQKQKSTGASAPPATTSPTIPGFGSPTAPSQSGSQSNSGGGVAPGTGSLPVFPDGSTGAPPGSLPPLGQTAPETEAPIVPGEEPEAEELDPGATEPLASTDSAEPAEERNAAGAVFLGLVAGALAFCAGLGARRWWMHWRYGL